MSPGREPSRPAAERQITVGQAGVGNWGKNLVRNFDELARLRWICDPSQESRAQFGGRYPAARVTERFDDLLERQACGDVVCKAAGGEVLRQFRHRLAPIRPGPGL